MIVGLPRRLLSREEDHPYETREHGDADRGLSSRLRGDFGRDWRQGTAHRLRQLQNRGLRPKTTKRLSRVVSLRIFSSFRRLSQWLNSTTSKVDSCRRQSGMFFRQPTDDITNKMRVNGNRLPALGLLKGYEVIRHMSVSTLLRAEHGREAGGASNASSPKTVGSAVREDRRGAVARSISRLRPHRY